MSSSGNPPNPPPGLTGAAAGKAADASTAPQFQTAEYKPPAGTDVCKFCNQAIAGQYYRVKGQMACPSCADQVQRAVPPDRHSAFARALLFGIGAAILGLIGYALVGIITGLNIGFVSLAVGYIIGKAMMKGSNGIGGRRYRIAAVVLTYAAVSLSAIPIAIHHWSTHPPAAQRQAKPADTPQQPSQGEKVSVGKALLTLTLLGLASPFLELQDPVHGFIGLIILFVGIQIAWKITAGQPQAVVDGPF